MTTPVPNRRLGFGGMLLAAAAGLAAFALFFLVGAAAVAVIGQALHASNMEGAQGYLTLVVGAFTGTLGFLGACYWLLSKRGLSGVQILVGTIAAAGLLAITAAGSVAGWYAVQPHVLNPNGPEPLLRIELHAPTGVPPDTLADCTAELSTNRNTADVYFDPFDAAGGVRRGYVPLYYRTSQRLIVLKAKDGTARLYRLQLPANPMRQQYESWSASHQPDFIDRPGSGGVTKAKGDADIELRYRVEVAGR